MEYREAVNEIVHIYGSAIFFDAFLSYSIMSDMIGSRSRSKRLLSIYYLIGLNSNIYGIISKNGINRLRKEMSSIYYRFEDECTYAEFDETISPILDAIMQDNLLKL